MSSFTSFPNLPTELRLEIWRAHFADCHGTQIHIFHSTPHGPKYANQDAASGLPAYNTLAAARVSAESWDVFRESFHVGDTRNLQPQSSLQDARGRLIDYQDDDGAETGTPSLRVIYATAAREELRRQTVEFALGPDDMVYIVDKDVTPLLVSLSSAPWARYVRRLAVQILNFTASPALQIPSFRLDRWARWDALLSAPQRACAVSWHLKANMYGFLFVDSDNFVLGSQDECRIVRSHARVTYVRLCEAFPELEERIGCVLDAVPGRAEFTIYS